MCNEGLKAKIIPNKSRNSAAVAIDSVNLDLFPPGDTSATLTNLNKTINIF